MNWEEESVLALVETEYGLLSVNLTEENVVGKNGDKYIVSIPYGEEEVLGTVSIKFVEEMLKLQDTLREKEARPKSWVFD